LGGQEIKAGLPKDLSISTGDIVELSCFSPVSSPENSPSPPQDPLGAKYAIAIVLPFIEGEPKLIDQFIMFREQIGELKEKLAIQISMNPEDFDLAHRGNILDPNLTAQEAGVGNNARLHLLFKPKIYAAEASSSGAAVLEAEEDVADENMEDVITTFPVECEGMTHEISIAKEEYVANIALRYAEKAQDQKYLKGYAICTENKICIPSYRRIEEAIDAGTMAYGKKVFLVAQPDNTTLQI